MKKHILYLIILLLNVFPTFSQDIINNTGPLSSKAIQQIRVPGIDDILLFQTLNRGLSNYALTQQTGKLNTANINQNSTSTDMSNQSYTVQSGNSNELTIGQIGSGNLLLGFQLGYLANHAGSIQDNPAGDQTSMTSVSGSLTDGIGSVVTGENNKLNISQVGDNNGVMAVQQGTYNSISAKQRGSNNYLLAMQKGTDNTISDYAQENESGQVLFDRVIQIGDNLTLKTDGATDSSITGNTVMQTGANLTLEINNNLLNTAGGVTINQTGSDMKVVIDQSFFSFPMK